MNNTIFDTNGNLVRGFEPTVKNRGLGIGEIKKELNQNHSEIVVYSEKYNSDEKYQKAIDQSLSGVQRAFKKMFS